MPKHSRRGRGRSGRGNSGSGKGRTEDANPLTNVSYNSEPRRLRRSQRVCRLPTEKMHEKKDPPKDHGDKKRKGAPKGSEEASAKMNKAEGDSSDKEKDKTEEAKDSTLKVLDIFLSNYLETADVKNLSSMRAVSKEFKTRVDKELDRRIRQDTFLASPLQAATVDEYNGFCRQAIRVKRGFGTVFNTSEELIRHGMTFANPLVFVGTFDYDSEDEDDINFGELSLDTEGAEESLREYGALDVVDFLETNDDDDNDLSLVWNVNITEPEEFSASGFMQKSKELVKEKYLAGSEKFQEVRDSIWILLCRSKHSSFRQSDFSYACEKGGTAISESRNAFLFSTLDHGDFLVDIHSYYVGTY